MAEIRTEAGLKGSAAKQVNPLYKEMRAKLNTPAEPISSKDISKYIQKNSPTLAEFEAQIRKNPSEIKPTLRQGKKSGNF